MTQQIPRPKKRYTDAQIIGALVAAGGMVHLAARQLGCDPTTIYARRDKSTAVADAIEDQRGQALDIAKSALKRAVLAGEAWAVCFTLKTLGKTRGYTERSEVEVTGKDGAALTIEYVNDWRSTPRPDAS